MVAVQSGSYDNIKVLLENKADITLKIMKVKTALEIAEDLTEENDGKAVVKLLEKEK